MTNKLQRGYRLYLINSVMSCTSYRHSCVTTQRAAITYSGQQQLDQLQTANTYASSAITGEQYAVQYAYYSNYRDIPTGNTNPQCDCDFTNLMCKTFRMCE